jgi:hypothetical protein
MTRWLVHNVQPHLLQICPYACFGKTSLEQPSKKYIVVIKELTQWKDPTLNC